jgi:hypothetical protein
MCIVAFPWLNRETETLEWGAACNGCGFEIDERYMLFGADRDRLNTQERTLFSKAGFLAHFLVCEKAQENFKENFQKWMKGQVRIVDFGRQVCCVAGDPDAQPLVWRRPGVGNCNARLHVALRSEVSTS